MRLSEFVEEDAAVRVASAFWHEFKATLGLRHHLCGIIIPQAIAATICARSRVKSVPWSPNLRLKSA